jgi:hypothetical protein
MLTQFVAVTVKGVVGIKGRDMLLFLCMGVGRQKLLVKKSSTKERQRRDGN